MLTLGHPGGCVEGVEGDQASVEAVPAGAELAEREANFPLCGLACRAAQGGAGSERFFGWLGWLAKKLSRFDKLQKRVHNFVSVLMTTQRSLEDEVLQAMQREVGKEEVRQYPVL